MAVTASFDGDAERIWNGFTIHPWLESVVVSDEKHAAFALPEEALKYEASEKVPASFRNGFRDRNVYCNVPLDPLEVKSLAALRHQAKNSRFSLPVASDALRYLNVARGNVTKALQMMNATEAWRKNFFKDGPVTDAEVADDMSLGIAYFCGRDRDLRPALVVRPSRIPEQWQRERQVHRLIRILVFCMEYMLRFMLVPGKIETIALIVDLKGVSTREIPLTILGEIHRVFSNHYPCRGYRFFVCNVPRLFLALSHLALRLLTERQRQKLVLVSDVRDLLKDFAPHQLEVDLGGSMPIVTCFLPFPLQAGPFTPGWLAGPSANSVKHLHLHRGSDDAFGSNGDRVQAKVPNSSTAAPFLSRPIQGDSSSTAMSESSFFKQGDAVLVWSASKQAWLKGVVKASFISKAILGGYAVPAGSLKVESTAGVKWIPSAEVSNLVKRDVMDIRSKQPPLKVSRTVSPVCSEAEMGRLVFNSSLGGLDGKPGTVDARGISLPSNSLRLKASSWSSFWVCHSKAKRS